MQGLPIATDTALALSTTETSNLVQNTYDYIKPGRIRLFCKASAATVLVNFFVNGRQICRRLKIPSTGTAGTLSTSDNLMADVTTTGGRIELTFVATTGTPTVDYQVTFEEMPLPVAAARKFFGA